MYDFLSYETLMLLKNLALVLSGAIICLIILSIVSAYYMTHTERVDYSKDVAFKQTGDKIQIAQSRNIHEALETFYMFLVWHFTGAKQMQVNRSQKRARFIFVTVFILLLLLAVFNVWMIVDIEHHHHVHRK